ncbi:2-dehydro-3-deoxygalactonokinase [Salinarimonas sp.]|uniref:2-dehydro-3-deoxygalactonokinase n=1 Tax=Salinarimonas sp. TaxID=2766526 RepID=UPI0039194AA4
MGEPAAERDAADWIAVDWGTSRLRACAMGPEGVRGQAESEAGMAGLSPDAFEPALLALVEPWLAPDRVVPVIACGMVGAREGWAPAPYAMVPCPPLSPDRLVAAPARDRRLRVSIVPGLAQGAPADVMRGEETQIAGFLAAEPGFEGVLCLPGTHTKWARVAQGRVASFETHMTGELYALLSERSVLRHGLGASDAFDEGAFDEAVAAAQAAPERLSARLFAIRAEGLLAGLPPARARARLSGLLIGTELAATRALWTGARVAIVGAPSLSRLYARALAALDGPPRLADGAEMTLSGLALAHAQTGDTP